jgi:hypothetical protein
MDARSQGSQGMKISQAALSEIEEKYWRCCSWGIWATPAEAPKSNIGDLSVFDFNENPLNRATLHADVVAVGLNVSFADINERFGNFHSASGRAHDYKLRYAFSGTRAWGCYMTDILKNYPEKNSAKVKAAINDNPSLLAMHFDIFQHEIEVLGARSAIFLSLGGLTAELLRKVLPRGARIVRLRHYSDWSVPKERYRDEFTSALSQVRSS